MIDVFGITKMLILSSLGFVLAMLWTPLLTHVLYKYKMGKSIRSAVAAPMFSKLHQKKAGVPTMGGVLVWGTVLLIAILLAVAGSIFPQTPWVQLSFLSRSETWLPLAALGLAGILGLIDDILNVWKIGPYGGGIHSGQRLVIYTVVGLVGAWWFYSKLGWDMLHVPFIGDVFMGWW
jgi:phospho-N-acetylmuramoyl-pentapeptide-transferase